MDKLQLYILKSTFENLPDKWGISEYADVHYSEVMKDLYLDDFPNAWKDESIRNKAGTIGANDYFNKWTGEEFVSLEDTRLNEIYKLVKDELADGSIIDGKRTGIPLSGGNHQLLFYNKEFVDHAPTTFDELIKMSEEIKERYKLEYAFVFPTGACYFILPILYGFGAELWSIPDIEPISEEALRKTIVLLKDLIYDRKLLPVKWEQENSMPYFMEGKAAFCIGGDWNINQFQKALNYNIGVCEIPKLERECKSNGNANYLYVSKYADSKVLDNEFKFCKRVLSKEIQHNIVEELYRMPALKNYEFDESKHSKIMVDSYKVYKNSFILPPLKEVSHMYHVLADLLEPNVIVSDSPEVLAKDVIAKLKDTDSYYK